MAKQSKMYGVLLAGGATIGSFAGVGPAHSAPVEAAAESDVIIVTASKREEKLLDVGSSISAVTGEDLVYRNQTRIEDFAAQVPGLNFQSVGPRAIRLILRGLNSGGAGATVGVVVDETPFSYQSGLANGAIDTANLDTFDMERIEVLKGPQGTLYGATAEGGLLKYVTVKPNVNRVEAAAELGGEVVDQGGEGGAVRGMINLPFWEGKGAIRASGFYQEVAGYVDNPLLGRKDSNRGHKFGGRVSILLNPTDTFSVRLTGSRQDQSFKDNGFINVVGSNASPFTPPANQYRSAYGDRLIQNSYNGNPSKNYYEYLNLTLDWDAGAFDLLSSTSYGKLSSVFRSDITSSNQAPGITFGQAVAPIYGTQVSLWGRQTNAVERWNQEFRVTSKPDSKLFGMGFDWQLGGFFAKENVTFNQFFDVINIATSQVLETPLPGGGNVVPGKYKEFAGFSSGTLHLTDTLDLALGGRYADVRQESAVTNYPGVTTGLLAILVNPTIKSHENKFTWSSSLRYKLNSDSLLYGRIATGYRSGGPNLIIPGAPPDFNFTYAADTVTNYELGLRTALFDRKLSIDLAGFYIDWKDIQILTTFVSQSSGQRYNVTGNSGSAKSKGIEWEFALTPVRGIRISETGAYTDVYLTRDAPGLGAFAGDRLPNVPKWSNTVNVDFDGRLTDGVKGFGGVSWVYTGARKSGFIAVPIFASHYTIPSYNVVNAQAGIEFGRYTASVYVHNIGNSRGLNDYSRGNGFNLTGQANVIQPQTIGIKLTARY